MEKDFYNGVDRLEQLGFEIIALISDGKKEMVETIENKLEEGCIIEYLGDKYPVMANVYNEKLPYNYDDWNKALGKYTWVRGRESGKYGIENKDDGLLLLLAFVLELVAQREKNWYGIDQLRLFFQCQTF